ncbi:MAG: hypothetical protein HY891_10325, partial [Deltaproteobacteria bacterium]|nr:hypothetical protein [Deltaproteobacteria bacterium]
MLKALEKLTFTAVILGALVLGGSICFGAEFSVPITVHEALREGVSGIDRKGEPVTVGIPFPKGELHEKNGVPQLALEGAPDYQFRTLARWQDGSVKWALVDFQADVSSGGKNEKVRVVPGGGNTPGMLAEERGGVISVNTGAMTVTVRKKGFNLFDSVAADGKDIVLPGASKGIVVEGDDGSEYLASNDRDAKVAIEENGPVRAVVKAEGSHIGSSGRMLDYTVRMHFYKGSTRVKVFYTLRNASKKQFEHAHIRSLDLVTKTESGPYAVASKHDGKVKERLGNGSELVYYQAVSAFPQSYGGDAFYYHAPIPPDFKRERERGFSQEGYWIKDGDKVLAEGRKSEYP